MSNLSFTLVAYSGIFEQRFIFAAALILFYPITILGNMLIIYTISTERCLHKPMYILIANLACINLYGGFILTPFILFNIFSGNDQISRECCLFQIFNLITYGGCEIMNLMVMAYDRYISICFPLHYENVMTPTKVKIFIAMIWLIPFCRCSINLSLTVSLKLCGSIIEKVYCDNFSVVKLACTDISHLNIYSSIMTFFAVVFPFFMIIYSYIRITLICLTLTKCGQTKLMRTCIPHIVAILNFSIGCSFEVYQSRFDMSFIPYTVRVILSLYFLIVSPAVNPILYGARTQKISVTIQKKMFWGRKSIFRNLSIINLP